MRRFFIMAFAATAIAAPAAADEITDAIDGALAAYKDGDIAYATEELNYALQLLSEMKSETLAQFLPAAQDGWTREDDDGMAAGLGMVGGIVSAATYSDGRDDFTITLMADHPMVASMGMILANPAVMAGSGGKMVRVGREKFMSRDGQLMALIGNRVLVQADGDNEDAIVAHLKEMDLRALAGFGS